MISRIRIIVALFLFLSAVCQSFKHMRKNVLVNNIKLDCLHDLSNGDNIGKTTSPHDKIKSMMISFSSMATPLFILPGMSYAVDGQYGILEGRFMGMIHPIGMLALYGISAFAAFHGFQIRRSREIVNEIQVLQQSAGTVPDSTLQMNTLKEQRSAILADKPRDKHTTLGYLLLAAGVCLSLEGGLSTWWRVGELFPGDHIFVGLAMTFSWAAAAALTPWMARGQEWARNAHIALNVLGLVLFTWQILSGWEIMINVWNKEPGW